MKAQQAKTKANEEAMFNENQRLLHDLASARCVQHQRDLHLPDINVHVMLMFPSSPGSS